MSVVLKRSEKGTDIPIECPYGCCTILYGKMVPKMRRIVKKRERRMWKRDLNND